MEDNKKVICGYTMTVNRVNGYETLEGEKIGKISSKQVIMLCLSAIMSELDNMSDKQRSHLKSVIEIVLNDFDYKNFITMLDLAIFNDDDDEIQN